MKNRPKVTGNEFLVLATPDGVFWAPNPDSPAIPPAIGKALRTAAACRSAFTLHGTIEQTDEGPKLAVFPDQDGQAWEAMAYYEAALADAPEPERLALPAEGGPAHASAEAVARHGR